MDPIEEIKSKLDIIQIIGEYVELKKSGINWKGCCPFHNEKTPSFMVNQERQFYYCFGCNQGGDIFTFLQKKDGLEFPEALKLLAKKAGVTLPATDSRVVSQKNRIYDLLEKITTYWQNNLNQDNQAKQYLLKRGLDDKIISKFRLGYAKESWNEALLFLKNAGFTETEIFQAGLTVKQEKGSSYYDRFRGRIIFPIADIHDNIIGFSARSLHNDVGAKYINSPETLVYKKSYVLYGLNLAKEEIRQKKYVILVEGNMDVIASHKVGVTNAVAVSGTALTDEQIQMIKRYTDNLAICFDMDSAGQNAARRSIDIALKHEMNVRVIQLTEGKDPDEAIKLNPQNWKKAIESAVPIMKYYFDKFFFNYNPRDIEAKKNISDELLKEIEKIVNKIEKDHWINELSMRLDIDRNILYQRLSQLPPGGGKKNITPNSIKENPHAKQSSLDELLLSLLINNPEFLKLSIDQLPVEMLIEDWRALYRLLVIWYNQDINISHESLVEKIYTQTDLGLDENAIRVLLLTADREYQGTTVEQLQSEILKLINRLKQNYYTKRTHEIETEINLVEDDRATELLKELQDINIKKNQLKI